MRIFKCVYAHILHKYSTPRATYALPYKTPEASAYPIVRGIFRVMGMPKKSHHLHPTRNTIPFSILGFENKFHCEKDRRKRSRGFNARFETAFSRTFKSKKKKKNQ